MRTKLIWVAALFVFGAFGFMVWQKESILRRAEGLSGARAGRSAFADAGRLHGAQLCSDTVVSAMGWREGQAGSPEVWRDGH